MEKIGLIAGNGSLPPLFLENARRRDCRVYTLAVRREAGRRLAPLSEEIAFFQPGRLAGAREFFLDRGVERLVMLGQVLHHRLLRGGGNLDPVFRDLLEGLPDRRAATILGAVIGHFESAGLSFLPSSHLLEELFLPPGFRAGPALAAGEEGDLRLGRKVALALAGLDVGLTVAVSRGIVLAVEAVEGTDGCIRRAARFARGIVVVKVCRPDQDPRYDLPVAGPRTIGLMARAGARVLALSPGTLVVERDRTIALAERAGITMISLEEGFPPEPEARLPGKGGS